MMFRDLSHNKIQFQVHSGASEFEPCVETPQLSQKKDLA
jgi:hypothetical protein